MASHSVGKTDLKPIKKQKKQKRLRKIPLITVECLDQSLKEERFRTERNIDFITIIHEEEDEAFFSNPDMLEEHTTSLVQQRLEKKKTFD